MVPYNLLPEATQGTMIVCPDFIEFLKNDMVLLLAYGLMYTYSLI